MKSITRFNVSEKNEIEIVQILGNRKKHICVFLYCFLSKMRETNAVIKLIKKKKKKTNKNKNQTLATEYVRTNQKKNNSVIKNRFRSSLILCRSPCAWYNKMCVTFGYRKYSNIVIFYVVRLDIRNIFVYLTEHKSAPSSIMQEA